jgi:hypothetical protein
MRQSQLNEIIELTQGLERARTELSNLTNNPGSVNEIREYQLRQVIDLLKTSIVEVVGRVIESPEYNIKKAV